MYDRGKTVQSAETNSATDYHNAATHAHCAWSWHKSEHYYGLKTCL